MNKLELYKDSMAKWEEVLDNIQNKTSMDYMKAYNTKCGFCVYHADTICSGFCPLSERNEEGMQYCGTMYHECLQDADAERFAMAEELCQEFVDKIKEVVENESR